MLLSELLASLITFFRTSLIKFYHNSQGMSDSFYQITEFRESNEKKKGPKHTGLCRSAMFWNFLRRNTCTCTVLPMTSRNLISHVCKTRKFVMALSHWKQRLLCDKLCYYLILKQE